MFACRTIFLHVGLPLHAVFLHVEPPPILIFQPLLPGVFGLARTGQNGQNFKTLLKRWISTRAFEWSGSRVIWRSWSKVMAKILSTCRVTKHSKFEIWGTALHAVFLHVLPPLVPLTCRLKYRPDKYDRDCPAPSFFIVYFYIYLFTFQSLLIID